MSKKLIFLAILLIAIVTLSFLYLFERLRNLDLKINNLSTSGDLVVSNDLPDKSTVTPDGCGEVCKKTINDIVAKAISTVSSKTKIEEKTVSLPKTKSTSYIPMGSTYTTTSTDWYTINDTAIYVDLKNEYGSDATVSWEASLKVAHANGQAFVRLWDDTNKIAVNGSELTTINNSSYTLVSSGDLPFWQGRNLYKVQVKSLNSFEVTLTGGKIKVSN